MRTDLARAAAFAILACRAADDPEAAAALADLAPVDGPLLLAYARRHRIEGLVRQGLAGLEDRVDASTLAALAEDAAAIGHQNLRIASEMRRLRDMFAAAKVDVLFLKGLTLAALAYPAPMAKSGWDIDVLVGPASLGRAAIVLEGLGYRLVEPLARDRLTAWHGRKIESVWREEASGLHLDLHTRLTPTAALLRGVGLCSERQPVAVGGQSFDTLADAPLLAYLAAHGASSLWFRLKWVADFAAFAHRLGSRRDAVAAEAAALSNGRALPLAFAVASRLFETPAPASRSTPVDRLLVGAALDQLTGGRALAEPTATPFGTLPLHLAGIAMPGTAIGALSEIRRRARDALIHRST